MEYKPNFQKLFFVNRHDADFKGYLKPGSLLRYAQQVATDQDTGLGFTPAYFNEKKTAYLLAKQALVFYRVPRIDETLMVITIPEKSHRAVNKRITEVYDAAGKLVAAVDSRWVLVDTQSRKIIRRPPEELDSCWNDSVERTLDLTIPKGEEPAELGKVRADYMVCDMNGHINNCVYADIACTQIPKDVLEQHPVSRMKIVYHREVPFGAECSLFGCEVKGGWYMVGKDADGKPAFEAFSEI